MYSQLFYNLLGPWLPDVVNFALMTVCLYIIVYIIYTITSKIFKEIPEVILNVMSSASLNDSIKWPSMITKNIPHPVRSCVW